VVNGEYPVFKPKAVRIILKSGQTKELSAKLKVECEVI